MSGPTFGFSTIAADRATQVSVAGSENALVGIDGNYYDGTTKISNKGQGTDADVVQLTNNLNADISRVDVEITAVQDNNSGNNLSGLFTVSNRIDLYENGIQQNNQKEVTLACSGEVEAKGQADVTITLVQAKGGNVTVEDRPITVTGVDFDCKSSDTGGGDPTQEYEQIENTDLEITAQTVSGNQNSVVIYNLKNTGEEADTVTHIEIREPSGYADRVDAKKGNELEIDIGGTTQGSLNAGGNKAGIEIRGGSYELDTSATIGAGETATFTLDEFTSGKNGNAVDMSGQNVEIILDFQNRKAVRFTLDDI
ncbi:hypothetical protein [Natrinema sp. CGMCC1.2065]|uniref:hypothetical protein n=1 Tax=Natrinema sp. CGMCC1.2065 TaxID=3445767 RepID=UPI003F4A2D64